MSRSSRPRRWRPGVFTVIICITALASSAVGLYPAASAWLSSYEQSRIVTASAASLDSVDPNPAEQLAMAAAYNEALLAGVALEPGSNVPSGYGTGVADFTYREVLNMTDRGVMGRITIPAIDVDLPIYHGTDQETLALGAGHLEGSHLPVGGEGTRTVITAHRGLANATMFTNLDKVVVGDRFTIAVLGEVLTYEVRETAVIAPDDTDTLRAEPGRDLATLITCTPLGINTHRIVVTGERVTPTPIRDIEAAAAAPVIPGFPWWAAAAAALTIIISIYFIRSGFTDARARRRATPGPRRTASPADILLSNESGATS